MPLVLRNEAKLGGGAPAAIAGPPSEDGQAARGGRIPCLTLHEHTERPITVSRGTNRVIGVDPAAIYAHWRRAVDGEWPTGERPEFWDGRAARHLVKILLETR